VSHVVRELIDALDLARADALERSHATTNPKATPKNSNFIVIERFGAEDPKNHPDAVVTDGFDMYYPRRMQGHNQ